MDWTALFEWIARGLGVFGGAAGIVSFWWTMRDRSERRLSENPFSVIEIWPGKARDDGWIPAQFFIRNRWDEPLEIKRFRVKGRSVRFCMAQRTPAGQFEPDMSREGTDLKVSWSIRSGTHPPGWSAQASLYFRCNAASDIDATLSKIASVAEAISVSNRMIRITPRIDVMRSKNKRAAIT